MKCPYAVKFFKDTAYAFAKCKITEEQKKIEQYRTKVN